MDLKQLRTFVTVAEHGSVSEAAVRLRTVQPALSRQIIELESELGLKLFDRIGRRLVLSKDGEHLLQECRAVLQQTALFREAAEGLRAGDAGSLRIAASPQILESVLAKFLLQYERSYPKVKMRFVEAVGRDRLTLLERGDCDIGIGIGQVEAVSAETRFATFDLVDLEIVAAFGAGFQLGGCGSVELVKLVHHPLLLLDRSYAFRRLFDGVCEAESIRPNVRMESRAPHTLLAFAEAGHGVAIIQTAVATARYDLGILRVTKKGRPIRVPMKAIWDKRRSLPPYAEAFYRTLGSYIRSALSTRPD